MTAIQKVRACHLGVKDVNLLMAHIERVARIFRVALSCALALLYGAANIGYDHTRYQTCFLPLCHVPQFVNAIAESLLSYSLVLTMWRLHMQGGLVTFESSKSEKETLASQPLFYCSQTINWSYEGQSTKRIWTIGSLTKMPLVICFEHNSNERPKTNRIGEGQ